MLEKTRECVQEGGMNKFTSSCPAFIIIAEEKTNTTAKLGGMIKNHDFPEIDIGIATAHICFAATEQGLSTCILGWFNEKKLKNYLDIKGLRRIHLVIAVGYAEDNNLRVKKRKSTEDISKMI
jgi:nitroreductase